MTTHKKAHMVIEPSNAAEPTKLEQPKLPTEAETLSLSIRKQDDLSKKRKKCTLPQ
jgi:hypothetical protein